MTSYMVAGYAIVVGTLLTYAGALVVRHRTLVKLLARPKGRSGAPDDVTDPGRPAPGRP